MGILSRSQANFTGLIFDNNFTRKDVRNTKGTNKSFRFSYVSTVFVGKQLSVLKKRKSTGPDELPAGMIKAVSYTHLTLPTIYSV